MSWPYHTAVPTDRCAGAFRALAMAGAITTLLWGALLLYGWHSHAFIHDEQGRIIHNDFVNVWAAGALVNQGSPAAAYDWDVHRQTEVAALGYDFTGYYGWHYPPMFLAVAGMLAHLPYLVAWLVWSVTSFAAYATVIWQIIGHRCGVLLAAAFPAALWNVSLGQNGFLTAALLGGALYWMERRPVLAGILLGLLAYKPQYGLLFPLILLLERRWQMIISASVTVLLSIAFSLWRYGVDSWQAFFHWMPVTAQAVFEQGAAGFGKLQSIAGLVRLLGGGMDVANIAQLLIVCFLLLWVIHIRRRSHCSHLKAAALGVASILASPYVYIYDLVVLAVPLAFLLRVMINTGSQPYESVAFVMIALLVFLFPFGEQVPLGLLALLLTCLLVQRRFSAIRD